MSRIAAALGVCGALAVMIPLVGAPEAAQADSGGKSSAIANDPTVDIVADGKGRINYDRGIVKATGYGVAPAKTVSPAQAKLMALGAARADALRTLAMTVSSIQVTSTTKVKNYALQSDVVETHLSALLQSAQVVSETMQPDGTGIVVVQMPLYGANSVASVVLPEVLNSGNTGNAAPDAVSSEPTAAVRGGTGANENGEFVGPPEPAVRVIPPAPRPGPRSYRVTDPGPTPLSDSGPFTCLLVDCRGLNIDAIMSPKLMDTTGREVYGTVHVKPEYAIETGIVGYPRSIL